MEMLKGKKTYIVSAVGVLVLVVVNVLGTPILGVEPSADWLIQALELSGLSALRSGVSASK